MKGKFATQAAFVKATRLKNGLSQMDVANRLGYRSAQFVSNAERGIAGVPRRGMRKFARAIGADLQDLKTVVVQDFERGLEA